MVNASRRGLVLWMVGLVLAAPVLFSAGAVGQSGNQAAVVVQHGNPLDGGAECVAFDEPEIRGFDLVDRSGFEYLSAEFSFGRAMCWLDGEGCETTDPGECFCDPARSWSLWVQEGDEPPAPAETGAEDAIVTDGTVHYWVWGPFGEPPLQLTSASDVCAAQSPSESHRPPSPSSAQERVPEVAPSVERQVPKLPATR